MINLYELKIALNEMSFENYQVDDTNIHAYQKCKTLAITDVFPKNKVLFYGPKFSGKTHLVTSMLDEILKRDPSKKAMKLHSEYFISKIIWEARHTGEDGIDLYINQMLQMDILVIEDINYVFEALKYNSLSMKSLSRIIEGWRDETKLLLITSETCCFDDTFDEFFKSFDKCVICPQSRWLIEKWLKTNILLNHMKYDSFPIKSILNESSCISECRANWLRSFEKSDFDFICFDKLLPPEYIIKFFSEKTDEYQYTTKLKSFDREIDRREAVYFMYKFTRLSIEDISLKLNLNASQVSDDLRYVNNEILNNENTSLLWGAMGDLLFLE